jgi:hypothetical protein
MFQLIQNKSKWWKVSVIGHFFHITCNRNVIDYIHFDPQIKSNQKVLFKVKCNQLQLITITNYDDPMSANQHQELPVAAMFVKGSGLNEQSL